MVKTLFLHQKKLSGLMQLLFASHYVTTPKVELLSNHSNVFPIRPFQKKNRPPKSPVTITSRVHRTVLLAGSGPQFQQQPPAPIWAWSWSLKDYASVCAGEVTCIHRVRCHCPGRCSGVSSLFL